MRRWLLAWMLGVMISAGGCFAPQIDLSGLDNLVRINKGGGDKEKKDSDKDKKSTEKKNDKKKSYDD